MGICHEIRANGAHTIFSEDSLVEYSTASLFFGKTWPFVRFCRQRSPKLFFLPLASFFSTTLIGSIARVKPSKFHPQTSEIRRQKQDPTAASLKDWRFPANRNSWRIKNMSNLLSTLLLRIQHGGLFKSPFKAFLLQPVCSYQHLFAAENPQIGFFWRL